MIWLVASVMLVVALLVILLPLWRPGSARVVLDSNTANVAVLREQLQELEQEYTGGGLTEDQFDRARRDLQDSVAADLLDDNSALNQTVSAGTRRWVSLLLIVLLPLSSVLLYRQISTFQDVSPDELRSSQSAAQVGERQKQPSIDEMVEILAARLRQDPENAQGWKMLGKTYVVLQRIPQALSAFEKAYQLAGESDAGLLLDYAEALAFANGDQMSGKPEELLEKALKLKPNLPKAMWLSGFAYFQKADYPSAINAWSGLLNNPAIPEETKIILKQRIAEARQLGGLEEVDVKPVQAASVPVVVDIQVSLHESIRDQVKAEEAVFVFARSLTGPPVPLAVKKIRVADLPISVRLDDSMAMVKGHSLSDKDQVIVGARVSRSGAPTPQPGDLEGLSGTIDPRITSKIDVVIDRLVK